MDEIFLSQHSKLYSDITKPKYIEEDYFELFPPEVKPSDAMLLWGTAHSRSHLHVDPYNWTGTNMVFSGTKLWKLYPPGQDELLYVIPNGKSGFPLESGKYNSRVDAFSPNFRKFPKLKEAHALDCTQRAGEMMIIPTGWFHQETPFAHSP